MKSYHLNLHRIVATLLCSTIFAGNQVLAAYEIDDGNQSETFFTNSNPVSTDTLYIGRYTSGNSLTVTNNGIVTADVVNVGHVEPSGDNTLLVTGSDITFEVSEALTVGEGGTGNSLIVEDGAWISIGQQNLGLQTNVAAGGITVGDSTGNALFSMGNGSTGQIENLYVGVDLADSGEVSLSGQDTQLDIANDLYLGYAGDSSTLSLSDGATLTVSNLLQIGSATGNDNVMNINNGGKVIATGTVNIDNPDTNFINIKNGGHLAVSEDFNLESSSTDGFKFSAGSTLETGGELIASNLNNSLNIILNEDLGTNNAFWDTGSSEMSVGQTSSDNTLSILNGASAMAGGTTAHIGEGENSHDNSIMVSGSNSTFTVAEKIFVGEKGDRNKLIVEDGAEATITTDLTVGQTSTARDNQLTVTGTNSLLTTGGNVIIGRVGDSNDLIVQNEASLVVGSNLHIGDGENATENTMIVTGSNTSVLVTDDLVVGKQGSNNTLDHQGGQISILSDMIIGESGDENSATVRGANTYLAADSLTVGQFGSDNKFYLQEGASATFTDGVVIGQSSSNNLIEVSGSNTTLNALTDLTVGEGGENNALVINGGTATVGGDLVIATSNNSVDVAGTNSTLNITDNLYVGNMGSTNALIVQDGGELNVGSAYVGSDTNYASIDNTFLITGADSLMSVSNNLVIGSNVGTNNTVIVENGGTLFVGGTISEVGGSNNVLNVNNAGTLHTLDWDFATISSNILLNSGSTLELDGIFSGTNQLDGGFELALNGAPATTNWNTGTNVLYIGYETEGNALTIKEGGLATTSTNLIIGKTSSSINNTLSVTGLNSRVEVGNDFILGSSGANNRYFQTGGTNTVAGKFIIGRTEGATGKTGFVDDDTVETTGNLAIVGTNSTMNVTGKLTVGLKGGGSILAIRDGGTVNVYNDVVIGEAVGDNYIYLQRDSNTLFNVAGDLVIGKEGGSNRFAVYGGTANVDGNLYLGASTNQVESANFIYLETTNAVLNVANAIYIGASNSLNTLDIVDGATASAQDLYIGASSNAADNVVTVTGTNSTLNVGNDLIVGDQGRGNSLIITDEATVNVSSNAWIGLASSGNQIEVKGTNAALIVGNNLYVGTTNEASSFNRLDLSEEAMLSVSGDMALVNSRLQIEAGSQVLVGGGYRQDVDSILNVWISTNSVTTNLVVDGTAEFEKDTTIAVFGDSSTNDTERTIVAAGSLKIAEKDATTDLLHSSINFQLNALVDFSYTVTNNTILLDNFIKRSWADSAGLEGMLADVANEIESMAAASNEFAQAMDLKFQDGMTGQEINKAMNDYYGEKASSAPMHNVINQGIGGIASELTDHGDNTRERAGVASAAINWDKPDGAAGPHAQGQELQGWISGYGSWADKSATDGFDAYDANLSGFIIGADLAVSKNILVGLAAGSNNGSVNKDNGASGDTKTTYGAVYASAGTKDWFFDGSMIYGSSTIDQDLGSVFDTTASYDAQNLAFYLGGGKEIVGEYLIITPQASLLANHYEQDAYDEKASDAVARSVDSFDALYVQSSLGCSLGFYSKLGELTLKPELRVHWLHEFNGDDESLSYQLIDGSGTPYNMLLQAPEEDIFKIGAGMAAKMSEYLEFRADLDTRLGSDYSDYTLSGSLRYQF